MEAMTKENRREIKKHIATIHCSNTLGLLQRKISNALLYHAYPNLQQTEEHEITIRQLCNIIGYSGNNHAAIKNALRGLVSTVLEWNIVNDQTHEEDWTASTILASVRIKGPLCSYAYSPRMKALLYHPSIYGEINLIVQSKFQSSYGLALYENCTRYKRLLFTKWFEYSLFRRLMGVPDGKYPVFRDFKRRVLDQSVAEVNTYSNLEIKPEIDRKGHQVVAIRFEIKQKVQKEVNRDLADMRDYVLSEKQEKISAQLIHDFKFTESLAKNFLKSYSVEYLMEKMNFVRSSKAFKKGSITDLTAYLIDALKNDYKSSINNQIILKKREVTEIRRQDEDHEDYVKYQGKELLFKIKSMEERERSEILERFELYLKKYDTITAEIYRGEGLETPIVGRTLLKFIKTEKPGLLNSLVSRETFNKSKSGNRG